MPAPGPTFRPIDGIDYPQLAGTAVWLEPTVYQPDDGTSSIRVRGVWQCEAAELSALPDPPHHAVAILAVCGPRFHPFSCSAQRDGVVFADDITAEGDLRRGYFDFDLFAQAGLEPGPGEIRLSASFAGRLSAVRLVELP